MYLSHDFQLILENSTVMIFPLISPNNVYMYLSHDLTQRIIKHNITFLYIFSH